MCDLVGNISSEVIDDFGQSDRLSMQLIHGVCVCSANGRGIRVFWYWCRRRSGVLGIWAS